MDAVTQLKKLFKPNIKRSNQLIVSSICDKTRQLGTDTWAFPIDFAFRDALDIKPTPRVTTKKDQDGKTILGTNGKPQKVRHIVWT